MANENTYASLSDARTQEFLSAEFGLLLADRNSMVQHPVVRGGYHGTINGRSSSTVKVPFLGLMGKNRFGAVSSLAAVSNTVIADASVTLTPARYGLAHTFEDLAKITDSQGWINVVMLARSMGMDWQMTLSDTFAALGDNYTETVGSDSTAMTFERFIDAKGTLDAAYGTGEYLAILRPQAWTALEKEFSTASGGSVQFDPATIELRQSRGTGFKGRLNGVDVFTSGAVPASGSGYASCMLAASAVAWADAAPPLVENDPFAALIENIRLTWAPERGTGQQRFIAETYFAASVGQDGAGVGILHS